ncbi:MAG: glutamate formimidoyltransferase [Actinomycetota bacterium]
MTDQVYGVVPNFSEGRSKDVIDEIVGALHVPGARVVYAEADADHNRLDTTVLGSADAVQRSAMAGAMTAIDLIDMTQHQGGHPRMGAADVIPFMPVRGTTMEEAVALARAFAEQLALAADIPVYLYDQAAVAPERTSLAVVRKGEFEGLRDAVVTGERLPDFGPHRLGRAGATAVGARRPLIAFNVYLDAADAAVANEIAKGIRESSGGLPAVRAIGFAVPDRGGIVTVSMNLVNHEVTGLHAAYDAVAAAAGDAGMGIVDSEIVGLVPAAAIAPEDVARLKLRGFDPDSQILERLVGEDR